MKFYFCEGCGKRITDMDIGAGEGKDKKLKGVYCKTCAVGVMTMENLPMSDEQAQAVLSAHPEAKHNELARCLTLTVSPPEMLGGYVAIVCAGTSDLPVAEEAAVTCESMGNRVKRISDVGVAGLHRVLNEREALEGANAIVVCAGMEGALPSVVAGLVDKPVIAVPTSVGYGASFGGLAALLAMLNSCAAGVTVVNIDNGFGAACAAHLINHPVEAEAKPS